MLNPRLAQVVTATLAVGALTTGVRGSQQDPIEARLVQRLEAITEQVVERDAIPGLALVIGVGSDVLLAQGWGFLEHGTRRAVGPDTVFRVGALSDQWLDAAVLRLVDAGRLSLADEVHQHLPGWDWDGEVVTLDHLLSHTSGVPDFTILAGANGTEEAILERLRGEGLEFTPGACFSYSPSNQLLLGAILAQVTGQSVPEHLAEVFFGPLELDVTGYVDPPPAVSGAGASEEVPGRAAYMGSGHAIWGGERLASSALDLFRWQRALIDGDVVSDRLLQRMVSVHYLADGGRSPRGYGFNLAPLDTVRGVSHGGSLSGYTSHVAWYPELDVTVIVLAVGDEVDAAGLERSLSRLVHDLPEPGFQDLALLPEERAIYTGVFMIGCNRLEVRDVDDRIVLHMLDHPALPLAYHGRHHFIALADRSIQVAFIVEDGPAHAFVLDEGGILSWASRVE